jgi:fumarate reductase (CoM/CoB) subunit A
MQAPLKVVSAKNLADCCIVENMCLTASLICRSALIRPESRGAHMRIDIPQEWDAEHSQYGHTFIAKNREGIEKRKVTA